MQVWNSLPAWFERRRALEGRRIGFVPTMGALHHGHISLVDRCRDENEIVVASIFVNPSQFNDPKDLERYPRTFDRDLALLEAAGVTDVLAPAAADLYPRGYHLRVETTEPGGVMEAAFRPGYLQGVMTVVLKLLNLVRPGRAYFGEKDYQQLRTIAELAEEFFVETEIVGCPTVREPSGLAASSRNALLSPKARQKAASIFRVLTDAADAAEARAALEREGFRVDYVEDHWDRRFAAVFLESVRLIDNIPLTGPAPPAQEEACCSVST